MTSFQLMKLLAGRPHTPFSQSRNYLVIPNVSWGFLSYEADMLLVSKARYCTEIEVKISMQDWKRDFEKRKHRPGLRDKRIKYQYYACPMKLALRYEELDLPEGWGVIGVEDKQIKVLKEAVARDARKVTDKELLILARLVCFRIWKTEPVKTLATPHCENPQCLWKAWDASDIHYHLPDGTMTFEKTNSGNLVWKKT